MTTQPVTRPTLPRGAVAAVAKRPDLWFEAVRATVAMSRRGWWRRPPFVPEPEPRYMAWRAATAYGSADADIDRDDLIAYLEWRRRFRKAVQR
jgi:hypothetical protein